MRDLDINIDMMNLIGYMNRLAERTKYGYVPEDLRHDLPRSSKAIIYDRSENLDKDPDDIRKYKIIPHPAFLINGEKVLFVVEYDDDLKPMICLYIGEGFEEPRYIIEDGYWYLFMLGE